MENIALELNMRGEGRLLADDGGDHLARAWAGALGSISRRPLGEGRLHLAAQPLPHLCHALSRLRLLGEHTWYLPIAYCDAGAKSTHRRYARDLQTQEQE